MKNPPLFHQSLAALGLAVALFAGLLASTDKAEAAGSEAAMASLALIDEVSGDVASIRPLTSNVSVQESQGEVRTRVRQTFVHDEPGSLAAVYILPMPEGARLLSVESTIAGRAATPTHLAAEEAKDLYHATALQMRGVATGALIFHAVVFPELGSGQALTVLVIFEETATSAARS